jgi:hypothetical protein
MGQDFSKWGWCSGFDVFPILVEGFFSGNFIRRTKNNLKTCHHEKTTFAHPRMRYRIYHIITFCHVLQKKCAWQ